MRVACCVKKRGLIGCWLLPVICFCYLFLLPFPVSAHGGGVAQLTNEPIGEYVTTIWLNPTPPEVGTVHLTVALGQANNPVLNQDVTVTAIALNGQSAPVSEKATHEKSSSRFLYESDLEIPRAGEWKMVIRVAGQDGEVAFDMTVEGQSLLDRPLTPIIAFSVVAVALVYGIWSGRKRE